MTKNPRDRESTDTQSPRGRFDSSMCMNIVCPFPLRRKEIHVGKILQHLHIEFTHVYIQIIQSVILSIIKILHDASIQKTAIKKLLHYKISNEDTNDDNCYN